MVGEELDNQDKQKEAQEGKGSTEAVNVAVVLFWCTNWVYLLYFIIPLTSNVFVCMQIKIESEELPVLPLLSIRWLYDTWDIIKIVQTLVVSYRAWIRS